MFSVAIENFEVISVNYLYLKILENAKGTGRLKLLFWYNDFIHLKLKFLDFPSNFILPFVFLHIDKQGYLFWGKFSDLLSELFKI